MVLAAADRLQLQPLKERSAAYGRAHFIQATSSPAGLSGWYEILPVVSELIVTLYYEALTIIHTQVPPARITMIV